MVLGALWALFSHFVALGHVLGASWALLGRFYAFVNDFYRFLIDVGRFGEGLGRVLGGFGSLFSIICVMIFKDLYEIANPEKHRKNLGFCRGSA